MFKSEFKQYKELAIHVLYDAIRDIHNGYVDIKRSIRPDKDILWIHRNDSNFLLWCALADIDPARVRQKYPKSLIKTFRMLP